jgi:DNA-binding GntR family transcriptional regulator
VPAPQDIRGFYVVREALESQAARLFCVNASPAERQELIARAEHLDVAYKECAAASNAPPQQLYDLRNEHMKYHLRVAHGARCSFLCDAIEKNQILTFNWFLDQLFGYPGLPEHWHTQLVEVLAVPDPEAADRAMRKHVRFRMDELLVRLEPFYSLNPQHLTSAVKQAYPPPGADVSAPASRFVGSE